MNTNNVKNSTNTTSTGSFPPELCQVVEDLVFQNAQHQCLIDTCFERLRDVFNLSKVPLPLNLTTEIQQAHLQIRNNFLQTTAKTQNLTCSLLTQHHTLTSQFRDQFGYWPTHEQTPASRAALLHLAKYGPATNDTEYGPVNMNPFINAAVVSSVSADKKPRAKKQTTKTSTSSSTSTDTPIRTTTTTTTTSPPITDNGNVDDTVVHLLDEMLDRIDELEDEPLDANEYAFLQDLDDDNDDNAGEDDDDDNDDNDDDDS